MRTAKETPCLLRVCRVSIDRFAFVWVRYVGHASALKPNSRPPNWMHIFCFIIHCSQAADKSHQHARVPADLRLHRDGSDALQWPIVQRTDGSPSTGDFCRFTATGVPDDAKFPVRQLWSHGQHVGVQLEPEARSELFICYIIFLGII